MRTPTAMTNYTPSREEAAVAATYRGRPNPAATQALLTGQFEAVAHKVVAEDLIRKWHPKTRLTKQVAVRAFWRFLVAVGTAEFFFPSDGSIPQKHRDRRMQEERALANFAMLRVMSGQTIDGAGGYVSHIRTWYMSVYQIPFGIAGSLGAPSITSQYLKSIRRFFPVDKSEDDRRAPVSWQMIRLFVRTAEWRRRVKGERKWEDAGVAVLTAYAGLFRMGELTSTDSKPFRPESELTEADAIFVPSFWTATRVMIRLGATKADQRGIADTARPRTLPVDSTPLSPGRALQQMLIARHGIRPGEDPRLGPAPLFQNGRGGHLTRDSVLTFMRSTLKQAGMPKATQEKIGTHSCRIGGATKLFQLGATADVLKHLGGWASDAYRAYVRIKGVDMLNYTRKMCQDNTGFQQLGQVNDPLQLDADGFKEPEDDSRFH